MDQFLKWAPILIAGVALAFTTRFNWTTQADRRTAARLAREKDLHTWAREVADIYVSLRGERNDDERTESLIKLSVLIDYGRLFFPNEMTPRAKNEYSKGRRSSVLDPLIETYDRCRAAGDWAEIKLCQDWRQFTDQLGRRTTAFAIDTSPEAEGETQYRNS